MSGNNTVNVAIRIRPLVKTETERGCKLAVERAADGSPQVIANRSETFKFNYVFDSSDTQQDIYEACVMPRLKQLLAGFNLTILAYGQTGSGKTYTMGTTFNGALDENTGVIPRAVHDIFEETASMSTDFDFTVKCSFVELYQEQFYDLLSSQGRKESTVDIREDKSGIYMPGLTEVVVNSGQEVTDQLMRGSSGRAVASTAMNEQSSRSHAIFTVSLVAVGKGEKKSVTTSKFTLVDLAGSERCEKTQAIGDRFKEGVNINKGLLALGNVINVLASNPNGYVSFRQSKLTRRLQESLGGNSITLMIACVSPADYNISETLSTLRYADRALCIKTKPIVNIDPHAAEINHLNDIIQKLRMQLLACGGMSTSQTSVTESLELAPMTNDMACMEQVKQLQEANARLEKKNRELQADLHQTLIDLAEREMRAHLAEGTQEKLKSRIHELKEMLNNYSKLTPPAEVDANEKEGPVLSNNEQWLQKMQELVGAMDGEQQQTEKELGRCSKQFGINHGDGHNDEPEVIELMQSKTEEYTTKQLNLNNELRDINRELGLKQDLHQRICNNFKHLYALDDDIEEKFKESEEKIQKLESERIALLDQLRNNKTKDNAAKLAEERRKRLQALEAEISDMRRKIVQQAKMLKLRENEHQKISNLSSEIKSMKESKVKLIRSMHAESEKFRQWKLVREKELTQLKSKDRKMQVEMTRQKTQHSKERQVLKRKFEGAMAINKRLKEALERQSAAQRQRHAKGQAGGKTDAWVDHELDVILSLVDAEHSLEQLLEDRACVNARITDLKKQEKNGKSPTTFNKELSSLEEELEMRSAQIADLQQKMCVNDLETRMRGLSDSVQNIAELRTVSKHILQSLVQLRRQLAQSTLEKAHISVEQNLALEEQRTQLNEVMAKNLRLAECKYKEMLAEQQRSYEEKVTVLLRSQHNQIVQSGDIERNQIVEEHLLKMSTLQEELNTYKELLAARSKPKKPVTNGNNVEIVDHLSDDSETDCLDTDDPEWVPAKRKRNSKAQNSMNNGELSISNASTSSNQNISGSNTTSTSSLNGPKCKCRNKCHTKRCGCYANNRECGLRCACKGFCKNPNRDDDGSHENDDNIENAEPTLTPPVEPLENLEHSSESTPTKTEPKSLTLIRPEISRLSELTFYTPSSKNKFL
ncbi:chromosome-associated kinesin KIF4 [Scaptodrosophila lebanonensis]|uniref:Chromosome-associated kinesin KIF4 n=1 Tax=Drosophila lebanonensis TaxID=7225 RepID=A0A6J2U1L9_DROLE|nr:chromosome-associated kinesin KIF4 [Scaptodrosophila lebanonensis]